MSKIGFIFKGKNTKEVLKKLWEEINKSGEICQGQRGLIKSIKGVTLIIENPLDDKNKQSFSTNKQSFSTNKQSFSTNNYPYWSKKDDEWYQDNFVRKETNLPPEEEVSSYSTRRVEYVNTLPSRMIFPYKYAWRSRYYDSGYGYLKAVVTALKSIMYQVSSIKGTKDIKHIIHNTFCLIHPEILLAVLAWKGKDLINFYLKNPKVLDQELESNRVDTLLSIINELKNSPNSRRAIIPSFTYPQIDQAGPASGVPVYQNYQLYINFSSKGKPKSLTSFHLHRSFDANGGLQLDINHDKDWGLIASKQLKLPLEKMVIYGNDVGIYVDSDSSHVKSKTNIKDWLFAVTDAYDPKNEDIEKRLSKKIYREKIEYTLKKLKV